MPKKSGIPNSFTVNLWGGLNTSAVNIDDLKPGESPDSLNWLTGSAEKDGKVYGDHIELRGGTSILQNDLSAIINPITGLAVGIKKDGTQVPVFSSGRSLFYFDKASETNIEIGTNLLPLPANNEDVAIIPYDNFSGYYVYASSPNSSIYKIALPNPTNIIDFASFEYRGFISKNQSRLQLWNRQGLTSGKNLNDLFLSYADGQWATLNSNPNTAPFTQKLRVVKNATDGVTKVFSGNLPPDNNKQTLFNIQAAAPIADPFNVLAITKANGAVVQANSHNYIVGDVVIITMAGGMTEINNLIGVVTSVQDVNHVVLNINSTSFTTYTSGGTIAKCEYFLDDGNGLMASSIGGTGTINYVTGDYSLSFNTAPITGYNVVCAYLEIDDTNGGVMDFVPTSGTIKPGDASVFPQSGLGQFMCIMPLANLYFCFHQFGVYQLSITDNDVTNSSQNIYRINAGVPYWRAAYATGDGIVFMDTLDSTSPTLRVLNLVYSASSVNPAVVPDSLSDRLELTKYGWDKSVVYEWGNKYIFCGKDSENGIISTNNNVMFVYDKHTKNFDKLDYRSNCLANYYGALLSGDSISQNPLVLFSGFDDLGYNINNYWESSKLLLGWKGIKSFNRLLIKGLIQPSQNLQISLSFDGGQYTPWETIKGNDSKYVSQGVPQEVGGPVMGSNIVGGGGTIQAYPYEAEIAIGSDKFERVSFRVQAVAQLDKNNIPIVGSGVGYVSVDEVTFKDIRIKSSRTINNQN